MRSVIGRVVFIASIACAGCRQIQPAPAMPEMPVAAAGAPPAPEPPRREVVNIEPPADRVVVFAAKDGGWTIVEIVDHIHETTGISILWDGGNGTFRHRKVGLAPDLAVREAELFAWLQGLVSRWKVIVVPIAPESPGEKPMWFLMDQSDPALRTRPVYVAAKDFDDYANREGVYVVTTLTLQHTRDTTRVRNALAPLSTEAGGIGRIQDIAGSRTLIVGDFAPVIVAMKRRLVEVDTETPPSDE